ncbi:hypothetical protein [Amaricoccus sp.]|uniref:hypothetical protein n=1 Tax=Amaricoccus sp. TaxID=1872485 RepID=UPI0026344684|nr:hypothetical protein [Amaricoccus sp.]HRO11875.1 hypothetical protein [Amaricoccus sp.]
MKKTTMILATSIALAACAVEREAAGTSETVGEWQIAVNENAGPGCFATRHFVNPTSQVQMGINATSTPPSGFLAIYVQGAEGIQPGQSIPATFAVGDRVFRGTFTGQDEAGFGGASVPVDNAQFIYDLGDYDTLTITYGDERRVIVPLDDADEAIAALRACQERLSS